MKWIDIPPVWLLGALVLAWAIARAAPVPAFGDWAQALGRWVAGLGLLCILAAAWEFLRARTTIIPHQAPTALVQTGIFRLSRNPIYLGDALILAGAGLYWQAPLALVLLPAFLWVIQRRFIIAEEARLSAAFGADFDDYAARVRRWI